MRTHQKCLIVGIIAAACSFQSSLSAANDPNCVSGNQVDPCGTGLWSSCDLGEGGPITACQKSGEPNKWDLYCDDKVVGTLECPPN
jgi:hypothetical protein